MAGAGYAAVVAIGQSAMRAMLRALYMAGRINHVVPVSVPLPNGLGTLTGRLFLGAPILRFRDRGDNNITIDIHLWGEVTAPLNMTVELTATVLVPPSVRVGRVSGKPQLLLGIKGAAAAVVTNPQPVLLTNPALPGNVTITPAQLAAMLTPVVQQQLSSQNPAPIALTPLGGLTKGTLNATSRVRDGVLLIGLDVRWTNGEFPDSAGDANALADIRRGGDVAMHVAREHVQAAFSDVVTKVRAAVREQSATLDTIEIMPIRGAVHVHGEAHNDQGNAVFDFDVKPVLTVDPRDDRRERVRLETTNIEVSVNPTLGNAVGAAFLGILTLGWFGVYASDMANAMRADIAYRISEGDRDAGARTSWITLPGTTRPPIKVRVQDYRITRAGTFTQIAITPLFPKPRILGVSRLWSAAGEGHVQTYKSVDYPPDVLSDDPQLRVSWTLTRQDTGEVIGTGTDHELRADIPMPGADPVPEIGLSVLVQRQLPTALQTVFQSSETLSDRKFIDRSHPYVRWVRHSVVPWVRKEPDRSLTPLGLRTIERVSAIHRTDVPNSCLFIEPQGRDSGGIEFRYFDDLPVSDLIADRAVLCDYCFFGGPDKSRPLPLPA